MMDCGTESVQVFAFLQQIGRYQYKRIRVSHLALPTRSRLRQVPSRHSKLRFHPELFAEYLPAAQGE
jgi:hypothetical protein